MNWEKRTRQYISPAIPSTDSTKLPGRIRAGVINSVTPKMHKWKSDYHCSTLYTVAANYTRSARAVHTFCTLVQPNLNRYRADPRPFAWTDCMFIP